MEGYPIPIYSTQQRIASALPMLNLHTRIRQFFRLLLLRFPCYSDKERRIHVEDKVSARKSKVGRIFQFLFLFTFTQKDTLEKENTHRGNKLIQFTNSNTKKFLHTEIFSSKKIQIAKNQYRGLRQRSYYACSLLLF